MTQKLEEITEDSIPVFIDTSGLTNLEQWNLMWSRIKYIEDQYRAINNCILDIEVKIEELVDHNYSWRKRSNQSEIKE